MKILFSLIFFLFLLTGGYAQSQTVDKAAGQAAQLKNDDLYLWDFGAVKSGKLIEHEFVLTNNAGKLINITGSFTSCGCTVSQIAKKSLAPNESTAIKVQFKTAGYNGNVQQFVYVNTDDPANPAFKFTIKANVVK